MKQKRFMFLNNITLQVAYIYNIVKMNFCFHFKLSIPAKIPAKIPAIFKISPGPGFKCQFRYRDPRTTGIPVDYCSKCMKNLLKMNKFDKFIWTEKSGFFTESRLTSIIGS